MTDHIPAQLASISTTRSNLAGFDAFLAAMIFLIGD